MAEGEYMQRLVSGMECQEKRKGEDLYSRGIAEEKSVSEGQSFVVSEALSRSGEDAESAVCGYISDLQVYVYLNLNLSV